MIKILFCGAGYGAGNIGDDAILAGLLVSSRMHLPKDTLYGALTFNPTFTKKYVKIDKTFLFDNEKTQALEWATHIVFGGASLITEKSVVECSNIIEMAHSLKKRVCMIAVGTSNALHGNLKALVCQYYGSLDMITLRSEADKKAAILLGLPADRLWICADGAFALDCGGVLHQPKDVLGINLVHEDLLKQHPYVKHVKQMLAAVSQKSDVKFMFVCGETRRDVQYDFFLLQELQRLFTGEFFCNYVSYIHLLKILSTCRLVLTMRMHIMIFCSLIGIPCIPIIREKKMEMMADELSLSYKFFMNDTVSHLEQTVLELLKNPEKAAADINRVKSLRGRSFINGLMLKKWVDNKL